MRTAPPWLSIALAQAVAFGAAGCEFIAQVDRGVLDAGSGGASTGTSASATSTASGLPVSCVLPLDCPGAGADCTLRTCEAGRCGTAFAAEGTPTSTQISGDCMRDVCDGKGGTKLVVDDLDVPTAADPCLDARCAAGVPSNPPATASTPCGGGKVCDGMLHCVDCLVDAQCGGGLTCLNNVCVSCFDGVKDGTETDVDCGGPACGPCGVGKACALPGDCQTALCYGSPKTCMGPTCTDGVKNGTETDVDCGGGCPKTCALDQGCLADADCKGGKCAGNKCAPTCSDGVKDNAETDVDCGSTCPPCAPGGHCGAAADCSSQVCAAGTCAAPTCQDTIKNGTETDVDCGGSLCPPCADGRACLAGPDCANMACVTGACALPTCTDGVKNGAETGQDCGGPTCGPCPNGQGCSGNGDCVSGICKAGTCVAPSCTDGLLNEGESDVDCGGPCPPCAGGKTCTTGGNCVSTVCTSGHCTTASCTDGIQNQGETDIDCGGPHCAPCPLHGGCMTNADCVTNACTAHLCVTPTCTDGVKNGAETGTDCGGSKCPKCGAGGGCLSSADCAVPNTCGGGNMSGVCGCTPATFASKCAGLDCGGFPDGCGGTVSCGTCSAPATCGGGMPPTPHVCGCMIAGGCSLNTIFGKRYGDVQDEDGYAVAVSGSHVLLGGGFLTTIDFGGGPLVSNGTDDAFVAALDLSGGQVWAGHYGDPSHQYTRGIVADSSGNVLVAVEMGGSADFGGGLLVGGGATDVAVAKFDSVGGYIWAKNFGDANPQTPKAISTDLAGDAYVAGSFSGTLNFGGVDLVSAGAGDAFLAKLDANGGHLWSKRFGDPAAQLAFGVASDGPGNVVIAGLMGGTVDFGAGPLVSAGGGDAYVASFDPAGTLRWAKRYGDASVQSALSIAVDPSANIIVGGKFQGTMDLGCGLLTAPATMAYDAFIAKLDPLGNCLWSHEIGDGTGEVINGVGTDGAGNVLATGNFYGSITCGAATLTTKGADDVFVIKYSPTGACVRARRYGDYNAQQAGRSITADAAGNIYVVGDFKGTLDVDTGTLISAGALDVFLLKLSP